MYVFYIKFQLENFSGFLRTKMTQPAPKRTGQITELP
jgi:hypothetical protein